MASAATHFWTDEQTRFMLTQGQELSILKFMDGRKTRNADLFKKIAKINRAFDAPSQRRPRAGAAKSYTEDIIIDDSDEDVPVMKPTRPTPRASSSSYSKPSYPSLSDSQSSRGVAFDDSDDEEDPFKAPRSHTRR